MKDQDTEFIGAVSALAGQHGFTLEEWGGKEQTKKEVVTITIKLTRPRLGLVQTTLPFDEGGAVPPIKYTVDENGNMVELEFNREPAEATGQVEEGPQEPAAETEPEPAEVDPDDELAPRRKGR